MKSPVHPFNLTLVLFMLNYLQIEKIKYVYNKLKSTTEKVATLQAHTYLSIHTSGFST